MSLFKRFIGHSRVERTSINDIAGILWAGRKSYIKWGMAGLIIGLVICFSIPKEYSVKIILASENNKPATLMDKDNLLLAAFSSSIASEDAYNEDVYPLLLNSIPFLYDLLDESVDAGVGGNKTKVRDVLKSEKNSWWNIESLFRHLFSVSEDNTFHLKGDVPSQYTEEEIELIENLRKKIQWVSIESTGGIQLEVRTQDPLATAQLAEVVRRKFELYIHHYRLQKSKHKLEFAQEQETIAKEQWYTLQDSLGRYRDTHQMIATSQAGITLRRLSQEVNVAYDTYQSAILDRLSAETDFYYAHPVFATVSPSVVPVKGTSPRKLVILSYTIFFSIFIAIVRQMFSKKDRYEH